MPFLYPHINANPVIHLVTGRLRKNFLSLILIIPMTVMGDAASADTLEQQRENYRAAQKALRTGKIQTFNKLSASLRDYPLYPYLRHDYLKSRLWKVKDEEIIHFLKQYDDLPMANNLRSAWLKELVRKGRWQVFLDNYTSHTDTTLQCYQLQARIKTDNQVYLLEDARTLWLAGKSQPSQCDPAFKLLYKSDLMTDELIWERITLVMQNGNTGLANYLSKKLEPDNRKWAGRWINMHNNPDKWTKNPKYDDTPQAREILLHGIKRLARHDIGKAVDRLEQLQQKYSFTPGETADIERNLAVRAAIKKHALATRLLDAVHPDLIDDEVFHWRLLTALRTTDWYQLLRWTEGEASSDDIDLRWRYWHARALEETGKLDQARETFKTLANERDYYGFIAADRIGVSYNMNHHPLPENREELDRIAALPAMQRAFELYQLNTVYPARREWHHALNRLTTYQMQIAAALATQWGWYDRAILTMSKAHAYDDLVLRFPVLYQSIIDKYSSKRQLENGWLYGLVRAESAFQEDARSPAGALGLMQVMPKTGSMTARRIGLKKYSKNRLFKAETNVPIGSAYLKQMLGDFNGNMVLATAAYNAGPHRVKSWLPEKGCEEADIWIEKIPFNETRKYVRRVIYFTTIYDWRLQQEIKPITQRMAAVLPKNKTLIAKMDCSTQKISYN
jgi:soluble lytic murein transglycosylase